MLDFSYKSGWFFLRMHLFDRMIPCSLDFCFCTRGILFPPPQWSIRNLIHPAKCIFSSFFFPSFRRKCHMSLVENGTIFLSVADSSHDTKAPKMINQEALLYCDLILSESLLCKKWSPIFWTWQMLCLIWCIWVLVFDDVQVLYSSFFLKKTVYSYSS